MRTIQVTVYRFEELTPKARDAARRHLDDFDLCSRDMMKSIEALAEHFDGRVADWTIDWTTGYDSWMTFDMPEMSKKEVRKRLGELGTYDRLTGKGHGDCKLTGWCWDESAIDGFRIAFREGVGDLDTLMRRAFKEWLRSGVEEYESRQTDEFLTEHCAANGIEFYADGSVV